MSIATETVTVEAHPEGQATTGKGADWRTLSACRDEDPELFFPLGETENSRPQEKAAKAVCGRCPVVTECLMWAITKRHESGVWGGTTERERRALIRKHPHLNTLGGSK